MKIEIKSCSDFSLSVGTRWVVTIDFGGDRGNFYLHSDGTFGGVRGRLTDTFESRKHAINIVRSIFGADYNPPTSYRDVTTADIGREVEITDSEVHWERRTLLAILPPSQMFRYVVDVGGRGHVSYRFARISE